MLKSGTLLLLAISASIALGGNLTVIRNGRSNYVITYPGDAPQAVYEAARDLQTYLKKATGVKLPFVRANQVGTRPAFRLGFIKVAEPEGFVVRVKGQDIHISGNDTPGNPLNNHWATGCRVGTWFGVCDFLEKQLDIRWFFPGEKGEYVPKCSKLVIDDRLNYQDKPALAMRRISYTANETHNAAERREIQRWQRRNRNGQANSWCAWHCWLHHLKGSEYFAAHPDWFAMVNGRRYNNDSLGHGLKICTTNPEALDQLAANLIKWRKHWPNHKIMMTLSPNDGGNFCECPKCRALDNGVRPDGTPIITDRILTYANEMAKRITKEIPDQKFGMYAYSFYAECVGKVKLHPAVTMMEVLNDYAITYYRPGEAEKHLANFKAWKRRVNTLYFYTFPEGMGGLGMPCYHYRNLVKLYRNIYEGQVSGFDMNMASSFGASGLNHYFYLHFAWKFPDDPQQYYRSELQKCYGPTAAPVMEKYFAAVEKRYADWINRDRLKTDRALGFEPRFPGVLVYVTPGLAEQWLKPLQQVAKKTPDAGQRARIEMAIENLKYCQLTTELYRLAHQVVTTSRPDSRLVAEADRVAVAREKQIKKLINFPDNASPRGFKGTEKTYRLPFDRNVFNFLMSQQVRQKATAERRKFAPQLDGKLDEKFWQDLKVQRIESNKDDARKLPIGAELKFAVTSEALYLGIKCEEPLMDKIADSGVSPKSPVWDENSIDIFIDPAGQARGCYQLVFNALGTPRSFKWGMDGKGQEIALGQKIAIYRGKNFWSAEVKIPLRSLTKKPDIRGDIWGINVCRCRRTVNPDEYTCWSPTFGDFRRPERFGLLTIK